MIILIENLFYKNMRLSTESFRKSLDIDDFVEESKLIIQDYKCPLCSGIYLNAVVDLCGHVFCKICILNYIDNEKKCPISGCYLEEDNISTLVIVNEILEKQSVMCKHRNSNCNWKGKLGELESHLMTSCSKQIIKCSNDQCPVEIFREEMNEHSLKCNFRIEGCQDCLINIQSFEMDSHRSTCPKFKISCPQDCEEMIERKDVELHISLYCNNSIILCPYKDYGCESKMMKKELNYYISANINKHSLQFLLGIKEFQKSILENTFNLKESIVNLESKVKKLEDTLYSINSESNSFHNEILKGKKNKNCSFSKCYPNENKDSPPSTSKLTNKKRSRDKNFQKIDKINLIEYSDQEKEKKILNENTSCSPLYSIKTSTLDGIKKKDHIFDNINISQGIEVQHTRATCIPQIKNKHRFVFANLILNDKEVEWRIIINAASSWIALGICIKYQVISNKYRFVSNSSNFNHSFFGFSINGYLWNANNLTENNFLILNFPLITKGDIVMFKYFPEQKELCYKILNKSSGKLTNVYSPKGGFLTPCVIFLNPGDEVLLETN